MCYNYTLREATKKPGAWLYQWNVLKGGRLKRDLMVDLQKLYNYSKRNLRYVTF